MNLIKINNYFTRVVLFVLTLALTPIVAFSQACPGNQVTVSAENVVKTSSTTFEFDIFIKNTGTTAMNLMALGGAAIYDAGTLPAGTFTAVTQPAAADFPGFNTITLAHTVSTRQLRWTNSPVTSANAVALPANTAKKFARVKFTSTAGDFTVASTNLTLYNTVTTGYTNLSAVVVCNGNTSSASLSAASAGTMVAAAPLVVPLPIELSSFTAIQNGKANEIRWTTEIEKNIKNFEVEKSKDAKTWTVLGAANPNAIKRYDMKDETPFLTTYYRLRTNENDGRVSTSNVVVVYRGDKANILELSPNPTARDIKVKFESAEASEVTLQVLDMVGRVHSNSALDVTKGTNLIDVSTSALPAGVYYLNLNTGATTLTQRFVKQ